MKYDEIKHEIYDEIAGKCSDEVDKLQDIAVISNMLMMNSCENCKSLIGKVIS